MNGIRRRDLLAAGLAIAVSGCTSGGRLAGHQTQLDWTGLRARLGQRLMLPGSPGYSDAQRSYNTVFDHRQPAAIALCDKAEDVQACLEVAATAGIPVAARSGGHSYAGYSTPDGGLVIDVGRMSDIRVDPQGIAEIGAGAKIMDVYTALARAGRCLPGGTCASIGIAGMTLGGGTGVLGRMYGLTSDRLLEARAVLPDTTAVTASPTSEPNLYWAMRGGGGGNFAIVTSFRFHTAPAPSLAVFSHDFPAGSVADVLGGWQEWVARAPETIWVRCAVTAGSPPQCKVRGCFAGPSAHASPLVADLIRTAGAGNAIPTIQDMDYLTAMRYFAGCSEATTQPCPADKDDSRQGFVASSRILDHFANPAAVTELLDGREGIEVLFDPLGGATAQMPVTATAFPHRAALGTAQVYRRTDAAGHAAAANDVAEIQNGLAALIGTGAYVNYLDPGQRDWPRAYYGSNLRRLRTAARRYDPDGVLQFPQGLA